MSPAQMLADGCATKVRMLQDMSGKDAAILFEMMDSDIDALVRLVVEACAVEAERTHAPFTASCIRRLFKEQE